MSRELETAGESEELGAGVVLTGGGASLEGTDEVARHVFGTPVRIGTPGAELTGLVESIRLPKFSTAVGLAVYGARSSAGSAGPGPFERALAWLREFF